MDDNAAVVVFSGGQDSTTCLFWAKKQFKKVFAICFTYGQRHCLEVELAREIAENAGVDFKCVDLSFMPQLSSNSLTDHDMTVAKDLPKSGGLPNTFVPGRNLFFISVAAVYAHEVNAKHIITGVSQTDFSGYPDCRDAFIKSLNTTINLAMEENLQIHTPLMGLDKCQTWQLSDELGVFDLIRNSTLTCYNGIVGDGCGECLSCKLRKKGLQEYLVMRETKQ